MIMVYMKEEILDIVDNNENVIGQITRKDSHRVATEKLGYIRVSDLFLVNSEGKIWIPTRTTDKVIAPNGYDFSVGGHVESGDSYVQTLIREAKEEVNLDIIEKDLEFISSTTYKDKGYKQNLYLLRTDDTPTYNPNDFTTARWFTPSKLVEDIDNGHAAKSNLKECIILLQEHLRQAK